MADRHFDLTDKVVIVTGAGQGIGRQYAHAFAEAGAKTVVAELNGQNAQKVAREIDEAGGTAMRWSLRPSMPTAASMSW